MKSFFNLTKNERKGVFVFSAFLVLIFCGKLLLQKESSSSLELSPEQEKTQLYKNQKQFFKTKFEYKTFQKKTISIPDTFFNPNNFSKTDWLSMGFSEKQANIFCNYIGKKGGLKSSDDILKVYGVALEHLEQLKSRIVIKVPKSNINSMNQEQWVAIKGIGDVLSTRILKYREKLGGFYTIEQIQEVYGIKPETVEQIKKSAVVNTNEIHQFRINSLSYDELKNHPYLKEKEVKKIIQARSASPIRDINQLFYLISDSSRVMKLKPYLLYD